MQCILNIFTTLQFPLYHLLNNSISSHPTLKLLLYSPLLALVLPFFSFSPIKFSLCCLASLWIRACFDVWSEFKQKFILID